MRAPAEQRRHPPSCNRLLSRRSDSAPPPRSEAPRPSRLDGQLAFWFTRAFDLLENVDEPVAKVQVAAALVLTTTIADGMMEQVDQILSGKDPRDMNDPRFLAAAFMRGGSLGIYGDFVYALEQNRYGSGPLEALSGPTIMPLWEMVAQQPDRAIKDAAEGKETHLVAQTLQDAKGFVPFGNLWYTKAAFDHLILQQAMEALSPGYLRTIRERTATNYGQDGWWQPGELTPERAPDLGRAVGE